MATPNHPAGADDAKADGKAGSSARDSAQQIWLAGLGAFSRAQAEGGKVFEALVKEGMTLQQKTQSASEKLSEATSRMAGLASGLGARASAPWDKLENIFEERVAKALANLGAPSAADLQALQARLDALEALQVRNVVARKPAPAKRAARPAVKPASKPALKPAATPAGKTAAKRAPRKKSA